MLERLTIHQKLAALVLSVALPTALAVVLGAHLLRGGQSEMRNLAETELPLARALTRLVRDHGEQALVVERTLAMDPAGRAAPLAEFAARSDAFATDLAAVRDRVEALSRSSRSPALRVPLTALETQLALVADASLAYHAEAATRLDAAASAGEHETRPELLALRRAAVGSGLAAALGSVDSFAARSVAAAEQDFGHALIAAALLLGFGLGVGAIGARRVTRQIDESLRRARKLAERVEHGVPIVGLEPGPRDEIGELLRALARTSHAVEAAQSGLAVAEARSRAVVSAANDGILTLDARGCIQSCNPPAERITGLSKDDLIGMALSELFVDETWSDFSDLASPLEGSREAHCLRAQGDPVAVEFSAAELRYDGPLSYMLMFRDITERKDLERAKNEFVSTVSHELRTPLTAIRGSLGLLEHGVVGTLPEEGAEMVAIARQNCDRLIRLINDILDLERMEAGRLELQTRPLDLTEVVRDAFEGIRAVAEAAEVRLASRLEPEARARPLHADGDRLIQVLTNLVSNAIKFSPVGGRVTVTARCADADRVRIAVVDEGPGIPVEQRKRLFQKFHQVDASDTRSKGGTGLGLAICKEVVEQHGGSIGVDSEPGHGSTFWFELEAPAQPVLPRRGAEAAGTAGTAGAAKCAAPRILLVEDDPQLGLVVERLLGHSGYRVDRAASLGEARERLAEGTPDLLLLDVKLPDGSGLDLVGDLGRPGSGATPVIVLSGSAERGRDLSQPLVFDWIQKPFDAPQLLATIQRAVRTSEDARVLVVDDDPDTRRVIRSQLESLGMRCDEAADGASAISQVVASPPDLVVLDLGLPVMDGFSVVEVLREAGPEGVPLLVYTGRDLSVEDREALSLGITRHLTKARTTPEAFVDTVVELIEAGRAKPLQAETRP